MDNWKIEDTYKKVLKEQDNLLKREKAERKRIQQEIKAKEIEEIEERRNSENNNAKRAAEEQRHQKLKEELEIIRKNRSYLSRTIRNQEQILFDNELESRQIKNERDRKRLDVEDLIKKRDLLVRWL